jgi:hypothetical protein
MHLESVIRGCTSTPRSMPQSVVGERAEPDLVHSHNLPAGTWSAMPVRMGGGSTEAQIALTQLSYRSKRVNSLSLAIPLIQHLFVVSKPLSMLIDESIIRPRSLSSQKKLPVP